MNLHLTSLALALAASIGSFAALPAHAALVTTGAVSFSNSASVSDEKGGGASNANGASLGGSSIQQFNATQGVLMGATLNIAGTQAQTTQVKSTDGPDNGNNDLRVSNGSGSSSVAINAAGVGKTFATNTQLASCQGSRTEACTGAALGNSSQTNSNEGVLHGSLGSYVGSSTVSVTRTAMTLTAEQLNNAFTGVESTSSTVTWAGSLSATYEYLLHADPTFGNGALVLDLDFGTVLQGAGVTPMEFSIVNAAGDRVGLDLDSFSVSGDVSQLYADLAGFSALAAGSSAGFFASFNTANLGSFLSTYTLSLSDADVGAASSRSSYTMTLNLKGSVAARPQPLANDVPEPGMLALASVGLLGLVLTRRRNRRG